MGIFHYIISNFKENINSFRRKSLQRKQKNNTSYVKRCYSFCLDFNLLFLFVENCTKEIDESIKNSGESKIKLFHHRPIHILSPFGILIDTLRLLSVDIGVIYGRPSAFTCEKVHKPLEGSVKEIKEVIPKLLEITEFHGCFSFRHICSYNHRARPHLEFTDIVLPYNRVVNVFFTKIKFS